jgi:hypothetical protein
MNPICEPWQRGTPSRLWAVLLVCAMHGDTAAEHVSVSVGDGVPTGPGRR